MAVGDEEDVRLPSLRTRLGVGSACIVAPTATVDTELITYRLFAEMRLAAEASAGTLAGPPMGTTRSTAS